MYLEVLSGIRGKVYHSKLDNEAVASSPEFEVQTPPNGQSGYTYFLIAGGARAAGQFSTIKFTAVDRDPGNEFDFEQKVKFTPALREGQASPQVKPMKLYMKPGMPFKLTISGYKLVKEDLIKLLAPNLGSIRAEIAAENKVVLTGRVPADATLGHSVLSVDVGNKTVKWPVEIRETL